MLFAFRVINVYSRFSGKARTLFFFLHTYTITRDSINAIFLYMLIFVISNDIHARSGVRDKGALHDRAELYAEY